MKKKEGAKLETPFFNDPIFLENKRSMIKTSTNSGIKKSNIPSN